MNTKYFLYTRKSTEDEDSQAMSIEAQLFELREFAEREKLEVIAEITESKSAKTPGREKFNDMIARIESMNGAGILAWHPDRLARNSMDGGKIIYLVDTGKIISMKFPQFWFEPTPQGLFSLQLAFGQSKYFSDNLSENIKRGIRQKIRRGEWLVQAPFGYINNHKTRNIEPHPTLSKVVARIFEEYATGTHTLGSLSHLLYDLGVATKCGTPFAKGTVSLMLSNRAYLGLIKHNGEVHEGRFKPLISHATFEAVQKLMKRKARPRKLKQPHGFPFLGLMTCGECGAAITAQFARGSTGLLYRYYRCTKKKGPCSQSYVQEKHVAEQIGARIQSVAICDEWKDEMLAQVAQWEKEESHSSQSFATDFKKQIADVQAKLDRLVSSYVDGDIPKESYLPKKEQLLKRKVALTRDLSEGKRKGSHQWLELLKNWIVDAHTAETLVSSKNFEEMKGFVQKNGSNSVLFNKKVAFSLSEPWSDVALLKAEPATHARERVSENSVENLAGSQRVT